MGNARRFQSSTVQGATITTTTELVVGTIVVPTNGTPGTPVRLSATVQLTTGTGVTAVQVRFRKGTTITDPIVGVLGTTQVAASLPTEVAHSQTDSPAGEIAGQSYVVTVQQTGATGNGSVQGVDLQAQIGD